MLLEFLLCAWPRSEDSNTIESSFGTFTFFSQLLVSKPPISVIPQFGVSGEKQQHRSSGKYLDGASLGIEIQGWGG